MEGSLSTQGKTAAALVRTQLEQWGRPQDMNPAPFPPVPWLWGQPAPCLRCLPQSQTPCCRGMLDLLQVRITEMWSSPAPTFSWVLSSPTADL